ncbi:MAG: GC-type dockerin domain-anchored protein [Planctomycetota bacterium]
MPRHLRRFVLTAAGLAAVAASAAQALERGERGTPRPERAPVDIRHIPRHHTVLPLLQNHVLPQEGFGARVIRGADTPEPDPGPYAQMTTQPGRPTDMSRELLWVGSVTSQADGAPPTFPGGLGAQNARSQFGVDGTGVRIGIISDSYNWIRTESRGIESGDLPGEGNPFGRTTPVTVLKDDLIPGRIDEGRGMAELIHDLAPGAELFFHSAFNSIEEGQPGESSIAVAIDALVAAGCDIIVDDVAFVDEPYFQDGLAGRAIDRAFEAGVAYFTAAGNAGDVVWAGPYNPTRVGVRMNHNFDLDGSRDIAFTLSVPIGSTFQVVLWWNEPYTSLGGDEILSDFDIFARSTDGRDFGGSFADQDAGEDPVEFFGGTNIGADATVDIFITEEGNVNDGVVLQLAVLRGIVSDDDVMSGSTVFGHAHAAGGMSVAAQGYFSDFLETFSSRGPATIQFDNNGNRISEEIRQKPDITATDGTDTSFFPSGNSDSDGNGFPNFFGTSAAAPHAAAVAALGIEYARDVLGRAVSPAVIYDAMRDTAVEVAGTAPGVDPESGAGRVDAPAFLAELESALAPCIADLTSTGATLSGQPGFGVPDGAADFDDLGFFIAAWLANNSSLADLTTAGATTVGQPGFGEPDGVVDMSDLDFFVNAWLAGCN